MIWLNGSPNIRNCLRIFENGCFDVSETEENMSTVNRAPKVIESYTERTEEILSLAEARIMNVLNYLDTISAEVEDQNLHKAFAVVLKDAKEWNNSINRLNELNKEILVRAKRLSDAAGTNGFVIIDTRQAESAAESMRRKAGEFHTYYVSQADAVCNETKNALINGKLVELINAAESKEATLKKEKQKMLSEQQNNSAPGTENPDASAPPQMPVDTSVIDAQIDKIKRIVEAAERCSKRLSVVCDEIETSKYAMERLDTLFAKINSLYLEKVTAIENAVRK